MTLNFLKGSTHYKSGFILMVLIYVFLMSLV